MQPPQQQAPSAGAASLLPDPMTNSIGNFFENKTDSMSFIQCYMLAVGAVEGTQYGVGFPVDMPVMLTYFEGNELKPVRAECLLAGAPHSSAKIKPPLTHTHLDPPLTHTHEPAAHSSV